MNALLAAVPALALALAAAPVDLGGGTTATLDVAAGRADTVTVRRAGRVLWRGIPARWRPWKLAVGDVDGDGRTDLVLGVHKATKYFPFPHNGLFVFGWDGARAYPMWLGSSLARPFVDFDLRDVDGDGRAEVVAVEEAPGGGRRVTVYAWRGFGFAERDGGSDAEGDPGGLDRDGDAAGDGGPG